MSVARQQGVVIAGAAETARIGVIPELSAIELHAEAARAAARDAGIALRDVDGIAASTPFVYEVSDALGLRPRWVDGTNVGGCSSLVHVRHAVAAIHSGAADMVLVTHGESGRSQVGMRPWPWSASSMEGQFEHPYGLTAPYATHALPVLRFLHDTGMTRRDLAEVVVAQREWAQGNPRAGRRTPVDLDTVLAQPPVCYPLTKEMCCLVSDGGGALVLMSAERARDLPSAYRAVHVLGAAEAAESAILSQMDDLTSFHASRRSTRDALQEANLTTGDIDHAMLYDAFAHFPLYALEDCGFVGRGESGGFIGDGHTRPGGRLPVNTNGGGLSYAHTGMYGMFAIQEAVRQLRGEAALDAGRVRTSLVHGVGMMFAVAAVLVLAAESA